MKTKTAEQQPIYDNFAKLNSEDDYSKACIDCIEIFAKHLDEGKTPAEAERLMLDAPEGQGLTGNMMGEIMRAIVHFHPRGDEVKPWWNKLCGGTGEEKGTINPAIVTFKGKDE